MKLGGLLWILEAICTFGHTAYQATYKAISSERGPRQERVLQQVQVVIQAALPLGPYDTAHPMVSAMSMAHRDAV